MAPSALVDFMENELPFHRFSGMRCGELREGFVCTTIPFRDELVGDPMRPALHGGVVSALADTAGGLAVWTGVNDVRGRVSPAIDLRVDDLRPGPLTSLACEATVVRQGNRVGVADLRVFPPDAPIATGKGVCDVSLPRDAKAAV